MAEASWPSPNHGSPARAVTDAEYPHLAPWASDGVFQSVSDVVYANSSGMEVHVRTGKYAIVQGHAWVSGSAEFALSITANSSGSTRVDTVVLRLDRSTWDVTAAVREGTPGAGAPALQRDAGDTGLWEIPLADVTVDNGAGSIAAGKVTSRTLYQSGSTRPCNLITDVQSTLLPGDVVYETSTGRWIGWTTGGGILLYQDTGLVTVTITGSWNPGGLLPQVQRSGSTVYLRGEIVRTTSTWDVSGTNSHFATLTAQFRPSGNHTWASLTNTCSPVRLNVSPAGEVALVDQAADVPVGRHIYLDTAWLAGS